MQRHDLPHCASTNTQRSNSGLSPRKSVVRKPEVKFPPLPVGACPRILSLDGGGVRGVVQLELLRGIEHALGDHIPASAFFDLIVGTGTGGLIAMTLSMRGQTVSSCSDQFKTICDRAFRPKKAAAPLVRSISAALGSSGRRYRSKSLYSVLQTTFGENNSLLESQTYFTQGCRVAVTSTNAPDQEPFLLANYDRPETLDHPRGQDPNLRVWQSVAAAIADPAYFPPFEHDAQTYQDGGQKCANPAAIADKERRLLWPELSNPDLFLSLGTGQNSLEPMQSHSKQSSSIDEKYRASASPTKAVRPRMSRQFSGRRSEELVDAEQSWNEFKANATGGQSGSKARNFVRLNPDLGTTPPAPDSKQEIESLQDLVRNGLQEKRKATALRNIAHRLVASSFYLDSRSTVTDELGERILSGTLACRFKYGSTQLRALGRILKDRTTADFEPYILIKPDASSKYRSKTIRFTKEIVRVMIERGIFALPAVSIPLQDESKETTLNLFLSPNDKLEPDGFPISGFPDVLDNQLTRQQSKPTILTPRSRQRAFSEQPLDVGGQTRKSGFLSRVKSTSAVPPKWSSKRATYSPPSQSAGRTSLSPHEDPIAEEQSQSSGAFVERRPTSRFWASYKDKSRGGGGRGKHSYSLSSSSTQQQQYHPSDLVTAEEEISAQRSSAAAAAVVSSNWHSRNPSVVTTDQYSPLYGGFDSPLGDGFEKKMWSPT
jgi:patatin-like phospholipase/acyl hydrolase